MRVISYILHQFRRRRCAIRILGTVGIGFLLGFVTLKDSLQRKSSLVTDLKPLSLIRQDFLHSFQRSSCVKKINIVYVKMIKCASSTIAAILRRFGLAHNLTFVLPLQKHIYIGWPYEIDDTLYRPLKTAAFNILCEHAVYNRTTLNRIMPSDTIYVTSLREPFSQFKSMLNYYNIFNISGIKSGDPFAEYLNNMDKYETIYKSHRASPTRYCIPDGFSMTHNLMSYNLGYPTGFLRGTKDMSDDLDFAREWIKRLDAELNLVLITEYFHESMVLLRRLMCWTLVDILSSASNKLLYSYRNQTNENQMDTYRTWSKVDYLLYGHFNATFWRRLRSEKEEFWKEVEHFRRINEAVSKFCHTPGDSPDEGITLTIPKSAWYEELTISAPFCRLLSEDLLPRLQDNYEKQSPRLKEPHPSKTTC